MNIFCSGKWTRVVPPVLLRRGHNAAVWSAHTNIHRLEKLHKGCIHFQFLSSSLLLKGCSEREHSGSHPCHATSLPHVWKWHSIILSGSQFSFVIFYASFGWNELISQYEYKICFLTGLRIHVWGGSVGGASSGAWPHCLACILARTRDMGQLKYKSIICRKEAGYQMIITRYDPFPTLGW